MTMPEFSRPARLDHISPHGTEIRIEAKPQERAALAKRFDLLSLDSLEARVRLESFIAKGLYRVSGHLSASVVQACVITLEPIPAVLEEDFSMTYAQGSAEEKGGEGKVGEVDIFMDEEDPPDFIEGDAIDIGEAVAEQLSLALEPFPRKAEAVFASEEEEVSSPSIAPVVESPFAVLARLRKN